MSLLSNRSAGWGYQSLVALIFFVGGMLGVVGQELGDSIGESIVKDVEVRYLGDKTVAEERILANMSTQVGDVLSQDKLDEDIKSLYASGDVDNVFFDQEPADGGVKLVVFVSTRAVLGDVIFSGNVGLSDRRLRRAVELEIGEAFTDADLQIARQDLEDLYQNKGYADATVSYNVESSSQGFSQVVFAVDEGGKALLKDILFEGNTVFTDTELRKGLQIKEKSIWRLFIGGGKINNDVLEADVDAVRDKYGDDGYLDADVEVRTERVSDDKVNLVFVIAEGEKYDVATVNIEGLEIYTMEEVMPYLLTEPGNAYSVSNVRGDSKMLRDLYGTKGYADVRISTRIDRAPGNQLAVTFTVEEGEKSTVRKINIRGNERTQDRVIRRELVLAPGEDFNLVKVDASKRRLETLQYFSEIDLFPSETGIAGQRDLNVNVTETSTGSVNFGAGFSSIDSLVGFVDVVQTNFDATGWGNGFTGAGQRFQLGLKLGTERKDLSISLYEPWFNDYRLGVGGELFYRDLLFLSDDYDQSNAGGRFYMRKPIGDFSYIQPEYTIQNVTVDVDGDASDALKREDGDYLQSELGISWAYDNRDTNLITRQGHRISAGVSMSGGFLGGDVETYGFDLEGSKYFTLPFDTILSFRGQLNVVDTWGSGDEVPIFERVFLGGANTLRGFDFRDVGPKDRRGEPLGGQTAIFGSAEYTFPIVNNVRGAVFYDIGMVSEDAWDFGGDINSNVGIGLRLYMPIGPIRLDFGIPMDADDFNDGGGKFNFNIGYSF